jgi:hypothetical protein
MDVSDFEAKSMTLCMNEGIELTVGKTGVEAYLVKGITCDTPDCEMAQGRKGSFPEMTISR